MIRCQWWASFNVFLFSIDCCFKSYFVSFWRMKCISFHLFWFEYLFFEIESLFQTKNHSVYRYSNDSNLFSFGLVIPNFVKIPKRQWSDKSIYMWIRCHTKWMSNCKIFKEQPHKLATDRRKLRSISIRLEESSIESLHAIGNVIS